MIGIDFRRRWLWSLVFILSFFLRLFYASKFSYIHPDEHLQGPQVLAHAYFGWASQTPWEFTCEKPIRSFVPMWLIYGIPMSFFSKNADPVHVLFGLRLMLGILTWILSDMAIDRLSRRPSDKLRSLLFFSTSYVTWTFQNHTLSNSLETILLLWFLVIMHEFNMCRVSPMDRLFDSFLLAVILVLGVFNRPTYIAFLVLPFIDLLRFYSKHLLAFAVFIASTLFATGVFVYIDTLMYGSDRWVIAPLDNILYNSRKQNLSMHGLHPYYYHLVLWLPQLLGPGILLYRPKWTLSTRAVLSGFVLLSCVPHQEARFLVPLLPLICLDMDVNLWPIRWQKPLMALWFTFNLIMGWFLGLVHQGGVIPAQVQLRSIDLPATVVWWKTYTPPLWMLGLPDERVVYFDVDDHGDNLASVVKHSQVPEASNKVMTVINLMGINETFASEVIAAAQSLGPKAYLVAPYASKKDVFVDGAKPEWSYIWHVSVELLDFANLQRTAQLGIGIWQLPDNIRPA